MDKSKSLGFNVPAGTWMTSYKINDFETWNKIKSGELNGFSIAGNFIERASKKMMSNEIKDTTATISTIAGGGLAVMGLNEWLTLALLVTGIVLNVIRIIEIRKNKPKE